jgi:hypothetical protein
MKEWPLISISSAMVCSPRPRGLQAGQSPRLCPERPPPKVASLLTPPKGFAGWTVSKATSRKATAKGGLAAHPTKGVCRLDAVAATVKSKFKLVFKLVVTWSWCYEYNAIM